MLGGRSTRGRLEEGVEVGGFEEGESMLDIVSGLLDRADDTE